MEITENETLEIKKIMVPNEQFCLHCRLRHKKFADLQRNRDKMIAKMRAQQLGEDPKKVSIRVIPENEAKAFDRFTVMRKIVVDRQKAEQEAKQAVFKTDPQAVQAALKKLEATKEKDKNENVNGGKEEKSKENQN
jgi:hypothetical protein